MDNQPKQAVATPAVDTTQQPTTEQQSQPTNPGLDPSKYAALVKRERELRAKVKDFEEKSKQWESEKTQYIPKNKLSENLLDTLYEVGITPDQLTQILINQGSPEEQKFSELNREIKRLKEQQENNAKQFQQAQADQYQQALNQIKREVTALVSSADTYELVKSQGAEDAVVSLIEQTYQESGELLSVDEATQLVEDHLLEQATTLAKLKKVQEKIAPPPEPKQPIPSQQPVKTLTNQISSSTRSNEKDRIQRAIAAFRGEHT